MKRYPFHLKPEHGLQIEETLSAGDLEGVAHLARYWWAWTEVRQVYKNINPEHVVNVVDLGCGCGYGSRILAEHDGVKVYGVDTEKAALNDARADYGMLDNLDFVDQFLEGEWLPQLKQLVPGEADVVTCFDVLEMCRHRDLFLEQVAKLLKPDGVFLYSGQHANRAVSDIKPKIGYVQYSRPVIERLLGRYFEYVSIGQEHNAYFDALNKVIQTWGTASGKSGVPVLGVEVIRCAKPQR